MVEPRKRDDVGFIIPVSATERDRLVKSVVRSLSNFRRTKHASTPNGQELIAMREAYIDRLIDMSF